MKLLIFAVFCFSALIENKASAYSYSYVPKVSAPVIYNFLYRRREKCETGKKHEYPGKKYGACLSCRGKSVYMIDDIKDKAGCFLCPEGTLIVKKEGYPMCLSNYPVTDGSAQKPNGENVSEEQAALIAKRLSANYKTLLPPPPKEETFQNKVKLKNVCETSYPDDDDAARQVATCKKLAATNDFLCPYVEKDASGKWLCRACPKNAPYRKADGGCFTCPYGEEMVSLENGETVCASKAPKKKKTSYLATPKKKAASKPARRKKAKKRR